MKFTRPMLVAVLAFSLGGCATIRDYCHERTAVCVAAGVVIVAGVALAANNAHKSSGNSAGSSTTNSTPPLLGGVSDARLKRDIRYVETLGNGLRIYTFRYWNDDRRFSGVLAQDLLADERFRAAVQVAPEGYYVVDFAALGLTVTGDAEQYREAGRRALAGAQGLAH